MPIIILCVCNSWIVISLSKSRKKTDALFLNRETARKSKKCSVPEKRERLKLQRSDQQFNSCESILNAKADSNCNISSISICLLINKFV